MRAREPDKSGFVTNDGVNIYYEVHGGGEPTVVLLPTWSIIHSRHWKMQVPFLAERYRVVTFDGRGNGRSDRPTGAEAYQPGEFVADTLAVMEAVGVEGAAFVALSAGARWLLELAACAPERVRAAAFIAPALPLGTPPAGRTQDSFNERLDTTEGWAKYNRHYWLEHYEEFLRFFFGKCFTEPHSTKPIDDCVGWGLETDPATLVETSLALIAHKSERVQALCKTITCPVLVIHGDEDAIRPHSQGAELAQLTNGSLLTLQGSGHLPHARDAVRVNLALTEFIEGLTTRQRQTRRWRRGLTRPKRALFVSSPIGLGHVQRDLAIARELRSLVPELAIHWWAQHPVTRVLEEAGEFIHPVSYRMASESKHWEEESAGHELHAFYAFRRMDEIFLANFMQFNELTRQQPYDLWIGDESWEVDYYLHENPELKTSPYVFLTDVIGFLPVDPGGDSRECEITADYNAEMIEQRARYPRLRDLSLYVGEFEDLPDVAFGPGLPNIRDWAREWFEAVGYVVPFDPAGYRDTAALRNRLGYPPGHPLLFAAVGGTAVGHDLLQKTAKAFAHLKRRQPDARMVMVTGPRIDPARLPEVAGLEKRTYVHDLFEHLACADAAVVQGGLSTTMELVAAGRPFLYFPLRKHWEQMHHVAHRLERYGAGKGLDYAKTTPAELSRKLERTLSRPASYREVAPGAARRAAERIASLL